MNAFRRVGLGEAFKQLVGTAGPACLCAGFSRLEAGLTLSRLVPSEASYGDPGRSPFELDVFMALPLSTARTANRLLRLTTITDCPAEYPRARDLSPGRRGRRGVSGPMKKDRQRGCTRQGLTGEGASRAAAK